MEQQFREANGGKNAVVRLADFKNLIFMEWNSFKFHYEAIFRYYILEMEEFLIYSKIIKCL